MRDDLVSSILNQDGHIPSGQDPYTLLCTEVVIWAVRDYRTALERYKRHANDYYAIRMIKDCEDFFHDELSLYSDMDGQYIIDAIKERVREEGTE